MSLGFDELFVEGVFEVKFPGGDVEHAVVKAFCDFWEFAVDEFAILVDGVAGEDDGVTFAEVSVEEGEKVLFDVFDGLAGLVLLGEGLVGFGVFVPKFTDHARFDDFFIDLNDGFEVSERF